MARNYNSLFSSIFQFIRRYFPGFPCIPCMLHIPPNVPLWYYMSVLILVFPKIPKIRFFDLDLLQVLYMTPYSNDTAIFPSHSHNSNLQSVSSPAPKSPYSPPPLLCLESHNLQFVRQSACDQQSNLVDHYFR